MAILRKGIIEVKNVPNMYEANKAAHDLPDGEYAFYICDKKENKLLPKLKYLYGVVLKEIHDKYPGHPPIRILYKKFEKMFAPVKKERIFSTTFLFQDMGSLNSEELDDVIQKIIWFASENLGITTFDRSELKLNELEEPYVNAYNEQWKDYKR